MRLFFLAVVVVCGWALSSTSRKSFRLARHWQKKTRQERLARLGPGTPVRMAMDVPPQRLTRRRPRPNFTSTTHGTPLYGAFEDIDLWFIELQIGTPPKPYTVQVDTGSSDLGIADVDCTSCGRPAGGLWNPKDSSTAQPTPCTDPNIDCKPGYGAKCEQGQCAYVIEYEDGSGYSAKIYNDMVNMAGINISGVYVGGIYQETPKGGQFEPPAVDGICGFAFKSTSVVFAPTITDKLSQNDPSCPNVFSMCGDLVHGGAMTLCGIGNHHSNPIQWTPMIDSQSGFYNIYTVDMAVNGTRLGIESRIYNDGSSTVDSGTTGVYIPGKALKKIFEITQQNYCGNINLNGICGQSFENSIFGGGCYKLSAEEIASYPNIEIIAGKENPITIVMDPQGYLIKGFCNDQEYYSSNIIDGGETSCLFGDSVMLTNQVIYDKDNLRMGFSLKANCQWK